MKDNYAGSVCKQRLKLLSLLRFFGRNVGENQGAAAGRDSEVREEPAGRFAVSAKRLEKQLKSRERKLQGISFTLSMAFHRHGRVSIKAPVWKADGAACREFLAGFHGQFLMVPVPVSPQARDTNSSSKGRSPCFLGHKPLLIAHEDTISTMDFMESQNPINWKSPLRTSGPTINQHHHHHCGHPQPMSPGATLTHFFNNSRDGDTPGQLFPPFLRRNFP